MSTEVYFVYVKVFPGQGHCVPHVVFNYSCSIRKYLSAEINLTQSILIKEISFELLTNCYRNKRTIPLLIDNIRGFFCSLFDRYILYIKSI